MTGRAADDREYAPSQPQYQITNSASSAANFYTAAVTAKCAKTGPGALFGPALRN